jgi:hypothetical protein
MNSQIPGLSTRQIELLKLTQVRRNLGNSHALSKLGFRVNVQIHRLSEEKGVTLASDPGFKPAEVKELTADLAQPMYQLRANHEKAAQESIAALPVEQQRDAFDLHMRKNYVYPKGGYAVVELQDPDTGKSYKGECHFSIGAIFNRKLATSRAFGKMFSKMLTDCSIGKRRAKQAVNVASVI